MNETEGMVSTEAAQEPVDPWAKAFATLEERDNGTADSTEAQAGEFEGGAEDLPSSTEVDVPTADDGGVVDQAVGGSSVSVPEVDRADAGGAGESASEPRWTDELVNQQVDEIEKGITAQAIEEVRAACKQKGFLHDRQGNPRATIDNPAVCKRDSDGNIEFVNPDTGRAFTGDDPRKQAQDWCDQYNKELEQAFNQATAQRVQQLRQTQQPTIDLIKFAPTYEKLDDTRKAMFEEVISDYEVTDKNGEVIGYSCDLNKALGMVDRQISRLKTMVPVDIEANKPTGPVGDMKATGVSVVNNHEAPKSIEEAMNIIAERELAALNKKGR